MRFVLGVIASLALFACGEDESEDVADPMVGMWMLEESYSSALFINISDNKSYVSGKVVKSGNGFNVERTEGTLSYDETTISFSPERSSCKNISSGKLPYRLSEKKLMVTTGATVRAYIKIDVTDDNSSNTITFGCYDDEKNEFIKRAVTDL